MNTRTDHPTHIAIAAGAMLGGGNLLLALSLGLDEVALIKLDLALAVVLLFILAGRLNAQKKTRRRRALTSRVPRPDFRRKPRRVRWPWQRSRNPPRQPVPHQLKGGLPMSSHGSYAPTPDVDGLVRRFLTVNAIGGTVQSRRGPFTMTCRIMLSDPMQVKKLLGLGPELSQALAAPTRIYQARSGVIAEVELPTTLHHTPPALTLGEWSRGSAIAVGLNNQMRVVTVTLEQHGSFYYIGSPGSGKTQAMMSFVYCVLRANPNVTFLVCASQAKLRKDWWPFANARGCLGLIGDYREMERAIGWAVGQMHAGLRRKLLVVIDDLTALTERIDVQSALDQMALEGRDINCHLLIGTHDAGSATTSGVKKGRSGMTFKVMYGTGDNQADARSAGRGAKVLGLEQLSGRPGDAILVERTATRRLATPWLNPQDVLALPQQEGQPRPWNEPAPRSAPAAPPLRTADASAPPPQPIRRSAPVPQGIRSVVGVSDADVDDTQTFSTHSMDSAEDADSYGTADRESWREAMIRRLPDAFPIRPARPLQPDEAELVLFLEEEGFSQNELCWVVFTDRSKPVKNAGSGPRRTYIKDALAEARQMDDPADAAEASTTDNRTPSPAFTLDIDEIDLSTPEGRALFKQLQESGTRITILDD